MVFILKRFKKALDDLKKGGVRVTRQRQVIIDILSSSPNHPSAYEIFLEARKIVPTISMSTVYYTLNLLKKEGLVKEIGFYDKPNRYDGNVINHINLICINCGRIEDYMGDLPIEFDKIEEETGFKAHDMRFEYYGYCRECKQKRR